MLEFYVKDTLLPRSYTSRMNAIDVRLRLLEARVDAHTIHEAADLVRNTGDLTLAHLLANHMFAHSLTRNLVSLLFDVFDLSSATYILHAAIVKTKTPQFALNAVVLDCMITDRVELAAHVVHDLASVDPGLVPDPAFLIKTAEAQIRISFVTDAELLISLAQKFDRAGLQSMLLSALTQLARCDELLAVAALIDASQMNLASTIGELTKSIAAMANDVTGTNIVEYTSVASSKLIKSNRGLEAFVPLAVTAQYDTVLPLWNSIVYNSPTRDENFYPVNRQLVPVSLINAFATVAYRLGNWTACAEILQTKTTGQVRSALGPYVPGFAIERLFNAVDAGPNPVPDTTAVVVATKILKSMVLAKQHLTLDNLAARFIATTSSDVAKGKYVDLLLATLTRANLKVSGPFADRLTALFLLASPSTQAHAGTKYASLFPSRQLLKLLRTHVNAFQGTGEYNVKLVSTLLLQYSRVLGKYHANRDTVVVAVLRAMMENTPTPDFDLSIKVWHRLSLTAQDTVASTPPTVLSRRAVKCLRVLSALNARSGVSNAVNVWFLLCLTAHAQFDPVMRVIESKSVVPRRLFELLMLSAVDSARPDIVSRTIVAVQSRSVSLSVTWMNKIERRLTDLLDRESVKPTQEAEWPVLYWCTVALHQIRTGRKIRRIELRRIFHDTKAAYPDVLEAAQVRNKLEKNKRVSRVSI
ncbi:hypothetical protein V1512DRAFT_262376 [Lipomyces arxii]|uniref:uncharacterized protein n=1 Tax=Lipomyces arxii TaxID=56418 RepID=UPI0034CE6ECE